MEKSYLLQVAKHRVLTSNGTLNSEGSLIDNIWIRVIKALKEITGLFIKKDGIQR